MNSSKVDNAGNTTNTQQSDNSTNSMKEFFQRFVKSYLLIGPVGENVLTNLASVNTVYLLFVFWFVLITSLLYTPLVRDKVENELNACRENPGGDWISVCGSVESITSRIGYTLAGIFITLAFIGFTSNRERVHQGFWLAKFLLVLILLPASFMIPVGLFDFVWGILCFVGSLIFYSIETVLILDFATTASDVFVIKITEERSRLWYLSWLLLNWFIYFTAIISIFGLYVFYTENCGFSVILITMVLLLCSLSTLLAVYFSENRTGFLHSGFCTLYILLLTLITLNQEGLCQEDITTVSGSGPKLFDEILKHLEILFGFLLVTYAALRNYNEKYYHIGGMTISRDLVTRRKDGSTESLTSQNEMDTSVFNASAFFALFTVFSLFATSKLTSLRTGKYNEPIIHDSTLFHLRSLSIILLLAFMIWSTLFPVIHPNENAFDLWALAKTFLKSQLKFCRRVLIDGCGCCNGPVISRYIFSILFILGVLFSCLLYIPKIRHKLSKSTYFCTTISTRGVCLSTDPAYMAVYRVCFAMAAFYLLFAVILVGVNDTRDPRIDLQYKAWPVKICLFCSLLLVSFLLPKEFSRVWIYTALVGTFFFSLFQLILIIHWTKTTAITIREKVENSNSRIWPHLLMLLTIFMIVLSLAAVVLFYVFFTKHSRCLTNTVFITLLLILIAMASLISVHPKIYDTGLIQCYVIVIFSLYLTWSGLSHNPDEQCNPVAGYIAEVDMRPNLNIQAGLDLLFTFLAVVYFSSKVPNISETIRPTYDTFRSMYDCSRKRETSVLSNMESQTELQNCPVYNFTLYHAVYFVACLHATVTLTNWFIPTTGSRFKLSVNWAAMCMKMTAANLSLVIFICIMAAQLFVE